MKKVKEPAPHVKAAQIEKEAVFDAYDRALREEMNKSDEAAEKVAAIFF